MQKFEGDIKKRWLFLAFVNMLLLLTIFGAIAVGFGFFAVNADKRALENSMSQYAQKLNGYSLDSLLNACKSDRAWTAEIDEPNFYFAVYPLRGDGTYGFNSNSPFLAENAPNIGGRTQSFVEEEISGHSFLTYTVALNGEAGGYIKVFAPYDAAVASNDYIRVYCVPFIIGFIIVGVIMSLIWGYIEIKPVMASYYKQKSFINDMSHEIRTPLAIIKGNLENAMATPDASVTEVYENLETCLKEVDYMTDMSSGLLNIVRGESKSAKKDALFSDTVSEVVDMYSDVISMSNKALVACVDHCDMQAEREQVKQLVTILIENAIKYTRDGDRINVKLKNTSDGCVLTVADTGIGVNKNELELIFDRFYRAENAKDVQGTGLGLAIAKTIVENMKGSIKAVQNVPCGLEIIVQFKRA